MDTGRDIWRQDQAGVRHARERLDGPFDIGGMLDRAGHNLNRERGSQRLARAQVIIELAKRRTRATGGAISLSIDSHLPVILASIDKRPVRLRPGRARLATQPERIGSPTPTNTIGIAELSRCSAATFNTDWARTTSGCSHTSSFANACTLSVPAGAKR